MSTFTSVRQNLMLKIIIYRIQPNLSFSFNAHYDMRYFLIISFISASISIFVFCKIRFEIHLREKEKAGHVSCLQTFTLIACWSRNWECPPRTWHRNQLLTNIRHIFDQNLNISSPGIFPGHLSVCRCSSPTQPSNQIWRWWYLLRA